MRGPGGSRSAGSVLCGVLAVAVLGLAGCSGDPKPDYSSNPPTGSIGRPSTPSATSVPTTTVPPSATASTAAPTTVPTTGPNVSPGEKPPVPANDPDTSAGAIDFATYWMQAIDWAYATESSVLPRMLYAPACVKCARYMAKFDDAQRDHVTFVGGRFSLTGAYLSQAKPSNGSQYAVDLPLAIAELVVKGSNGRVVESDKALSNLVSTVWLVWTPTGWKVVDWVIMDYSS